VQIITNYLPLANYLIDQEHDSVIIMGGQYNRSQSITLSPQGSENSLYAGHWMFTSGKGLTAEGLYKTDMLTAMAEQKCLTWSANWRCWSTAAKSANAPECCSARPGKSTW
jgi:DeoR family ulaG and ulaABCDEF operon transcriptional repressor